MSLVQALLTDSGLSTQIRQRATDRAFADPGIPVPNPTTSFWMKNGPAHPALSRQKDVDQSRRRDDLPLPPSSPPSGITPSTAAAQLHSLPAEAEIVIIGSGITGASIARTLLDHGGLLQRHHAGMNQNQNEAGGGRPAIVMLDAREICGGATGRNGGHILETGEEFLELEKAYGVEMAKKVMRFRLRHLEEIIRVGREEGDGLMAKAQVRKVEFLSVYFDEEVWRPAVQCIERLRKCLNEDGDVLSEWKILEKGEIPEEFSLPQACGVIAGPAGALWPYKFVTGVLGRLKEEYSDDFIIKENVPVTAIRTFDAEEGKEGGEERSGGLRYSITTPEGCIRARHIIHCTNAHVGHLVPGLRGRIYPIRGQMSAQQPGNCFRWQGSEHSWIFNYDRGFDYLTQLPGEGEEGGKMMFGGGFAQGKDYGIADLGVSRDDELSLYADIHLSGALSVVFGRENWHNAIRATPTSTDTSTTKTTAGSRDGLIPRVEMMWTGNMGFSADGLPWVGRLPMSVTGRNESSEWISCAFSGEGMVQAWLSGRALAWMVLRDGYGNEDVEDLSWFPEAMLVTEERITKSVLPRQVK